MVTKVNFLFLMTSLLIAACSPSAAQPTEATSLSMVAADETIVTEGRIEPVNYGDVAFNAGGAISDVLVKEGNQVKRGDILIRLGNESDKAYTAAPLELVTPRQAYDDLLNSSGTEAAQAVIDLKEAQKAYDKADDYLTLNGTVESISQTYAEKQGDIVYEIIIRLPDTHPDILWGMTAVVNSAEPQD